MWWFKILAFRQISRLPPPRLRKRSNTVEGLVDEEAADTSDDVVLLERQDSGIAAASHAPNKSPRTPSVPANRVFQRISAYIDEAEEQLQHAEASH